MDKILKTRERNFNLNWFFKLNVDKDEALSGEFDEKKWENLDLPHDWSIYFDFDPNSSAQNEGGQLNGGEAWYCKNFTLAEEDLDKLVRLCFDGVYMNATVYVNGQLVGQYPNGYNAFSYDITNFLHKNGQENRLAVHVVNQQPSSRWYSGSGIYRDVHLLVTDKVHLELAGTTILTPKLDSQWQSLVDTEISSRVVNEDSQDREVEVAYQILKKDGRAVTELVKSVPRKVPAHQTVVFQEVLQVEQPDLWTVLDDNPALYELVTRIYRDGHLVDVQKEVFGYRYLNWTPNDGFSLNGQALKFHGVCLHHDHGSLGAVENYKAEYRRLQQMKSMGVNAIRTSHNPASPQTLQIAAELGLLVQEEAFDTWYAGKKLFDYGRFFEKSASHPDAKPGETWSDFDLRTMVERGKNNPAIIMWSIGNEIGEADGDDHSLATVKRLVGVVKSVDQTRYVTMGTDKFRFGDGSGGHEKIAEELDTVGLNYAEDNYLNLRSKHPNWLMYGSETSSATRTRGSYFQPEQEWVGSNEAIRNFEQSDYGNDRVAWGKTATASWTFDRDQAGYAGQFIWTGTDYIGEPTPWHNQNATPVKSSYFGIVDTAGIPKNDFYLYQSQWLSVDKHPMVHLLPHWNWDNPDLLAQVADAENRIPVRAYSNAASVELVLNGQSQGIKSFTKKERSDGRIYQEGAKPDELYLEWKLPYQPGQLEAIARDERGQEVARDSVVTAGQPAGVRLVTEELALSADGKDLAYIYFEIVDIAGNVVPTANNLVRFHLQGQGRIIGVDNGEQASRERYQAQADGTWIRRAFHGKGLVIVKSTEQVGSFSLSAYSGQLKSDQVTIFTGKSDKLDGTILGVESTKVQVPLGQDPQLPARLPVVYSDGSSQEKAVTWSQADYSQAGLVLVDGLVVGYPVQAQVQVLGVETVLPVIKRMLPQPQLTEVDRSAVKILTDGSWVQEEVDQWQIAPEDQEKLSQTASRVRAHGQLAGQDVEAILLISEDRSIEEVPVKIDIDGKAVQFENGVSYQPLSYGTEPPFIYAQAERALVTVVQASPANGLRAQIFVQLLDGAPLQEYAVQFLQEDAQIDGLWLELDKQNLVEDQTVAFQMWAHYQDGAERALPADRLRFCNQGSGRVSVRGDLLELREAGEVHLRASFGAISTQLDLHILQNMENKEVRGIRPISVVTVLHQQPQLPANVTVDFDKGFPKELPVVWRSILATQLSTYHSFVVEGQVDGVALPAQAQVVVEGVIAVEDVSTVTLVGEMPQLPESVRTYWSNGKSQVAKVVWEELNVANCETVGELRLHGQVEGTALPSHLHVRVTDQTVQGDNISEQWTGSDLPLAFASNSHQDFAISHINDKVISFDDQPANRWLSNPDRSEVFVGILFGDAGNLTKQTVDNLQVAFYEDAVAGLPEGYVIEYYVGSQVPTLPQNPGLVEKEDHVFNDEGNWRAVENLQAPNQLQPGQMNVFSFDRVATFALRLRMKKTADQTSVGITELQIFSKQVLAKEQSEIKICVNDQELADFNPAQTDYYLPQTNEEPVVTASTSLYGLATIVPRVNEDKPVRIIHKAENGEMLQEYRLHFN